MNINGGDTCYTGVIRFIDWFKFSGASSRIHSEVAIKDVVFFSTIFQEVTMTHVVVTKVILDLPKKSNLTYKQPVQEQGIVVSGMSI